MDREFDIESKAVTALAVALFLGFNGRNPRGLAAYRDRGLNAPRPQFRRTPTP